MTVPSSEESAAKKALASLHRAAAKKGKKKDKDKSKSESGDGYVTDASTTSTSSKASKASKRAHSPGETAVAKKSDVKVTPKH